MACDEINGAMCEMFMLLNRYGEVVSTKNMVC